MRWFDNLSVSVKIGVSSGFLVCALVYISYEAFHGFTSWSRASEQVRDNRIPTIRALTRIDTERALIRAQTYESLSETRAYEDKDRLRAIADKRARSWQVIDEHWQAVSRIPRLTEQGRQQFARMTDAIDAWRGAYVEIDELLRTLIETRDPALFDQIMERYRDKIAQTLAISNRMGDAVTEMVNGNMERAVAQADAAVETAHAFQRWALGVDAVVILLALLMTGLTLRGIVRPLRTLLDHFAAIGNGDYGQTIEETRRDEIGRALKGLAAMQRKLAADIGETRRIAGENLRIRYALDSVASNVMVSDADGQIVYANPSVIAMFRQCVSAIRRDLPNFDPEALVGSSVDVFHRKPSHQRSMMDSMRSRHETQIGIGGRTFHLSANPIFDQEGGRIGVAIEWKDRTEELRVEREVTSLVEGALAGNFSNRMATEDLHGFFKGLGEGINTLMELTARGLGDIAAVLNAIAQGDLTRHIDSDYQGTFGQLKNDTNDTVDKLKELIGRIKESVETINTAAREIATGNSDLSQRTEEQASSLEETASSMEQLTSTVKQNADNARQANLLANGAREYATKGGEQVLAAVDSMNAITESSSKISNIITVIDGIAFQTNILALNAAVEAARAGEQGRGFAVVAGEVRNLAQRSATAAKEIKTLITADADTIQTGSRLVREAGETMRGIVDQVKRVSDIIAEISAASDEQTAGIEQVNQAIMQMDDMTQQNASLVEQAAAAAEALDEQAQGLARAVGLFRVDHQASSEPSQVTGVRTRQPGASSRSGLQPAPGRRLSTPGKSPARTPTKGGGEDEWEEF